MKTVSYCDGSLAPGSGVAVPQLCLGQLKSGSLHSWSFQESAPVFSA